jgi:CBS domain-containing protein
LNAIDLMSPQVIAASQNNTAEQISTRLLSGEFNGLPVVDEKDSVIGIVTALDILKAIQEGGARGGGGEGKKLNSILAKDIMTPNPSVVKTDTPIEKVIDIIIEQEIVLVPVVDNNNRIVGVVSRLDIIREKLNEGFITIGKREGLSRT